MEFVGFIQSSRRVVEQASHFLKEIKSAKDLKERVRDVRDQLNSRLEALQDIRANLLDVKEQLAQDTDLKTHTLAQKTLATVKVCEKTVENLESLRHTLKERIQPKDGRWNMHMLADFRSLVKKWQELEQRLSNHLQILPTSYMTWQGSFTAWQRESYGLEMEKRISEAVVKAYIEANSTHPKTSSPSNDLVKTGGWSDSASNTVITNHSKSKQSSSTYFWVGFKNSKFQIVRKNGNIKVSTRLPSWLLSSAYDICFYRSCSGFSIQLRTWNIVGHNSKILDLVGRGDVSSVLALFRQGKASPFDRDPMGHSLLNRAAYRRKPEMCQLLISHGLGASIEDGKDKYGENSIVPLLVNRGPEDYMGIVKDSPEREQVVEIFQRQLPWLDEIPAKRLFDLFDFDHGRRVEEFQRRFMPSYSDLPLRERLEATRLGSFVFSNDNLLMGLIKGYSSVGPPLTKNDVQNSTTEELSLLHSGAVQFSLTHAEILLQGERSIFWEMYEKVPDNLAVRAASLSNPVDLHSIETITPWEHWRINVWTGTPLISALGGAMSYVNGSTCLSELYVYHRKKICTLFYMDTVLQGTLQYWLAILEKAGIDLRKYGEREAGVLRQNCKNVKGAFDAEAMQDSRSIARPVIGPYSRRLFREGDYYWIPIRILGIEYGAHACDWNLLWAPEYEAFASEFWRLIDEKSEEEEEEEVAIPGSWIET